MIVDLKIGQTKIDMLDPDAPGELELVYDSWLQSYYKTSNVVRSCPLGLYKQGQRAVIAELLERADTRILVARDPEMHDVVKGWLCAELLPAGTIIHYAYTRAPHRQNRVFTRLLEALGHLPHMPLIYTHWTFYAKEFRHAGKSAGQGLAGKFGAIYNPYLAR